MEFCLQMLLLGFEPGPVQVQASCYNATPLVIIASFTGGLNDGRVENVLM